jgi:ribonuclease III
MNHNHLSVFIERFSYPFKNPSLIEEALRHRSYVNEQVGINLQDNERLEFLGDAVLNLVISHILMARFPDIDEGELSRMRANLVNEGQLAHIARRLNLGACIQLGKGERMTDGHDKSSILANTFEAVLAAVYLDGGFQAAFNIIQMHFDPLLNEIQDRPAYQDYKSQFQERVQLYDQQIPVYQVIDERGPDHDKTFRVSLNAMGISTEGVGKSKKLAEQDAARKALEFLGDRQENELNHDRTGEK